jgi:hypothetical protein
MRLIVKRTSFLQVSAVLILLIMTNACGMYPQKSALESADLPKTIVVLPVETLSHEEATQPHQGKNRLEEGADVLTRLFSEYFSENESVVVISESRKEAVIGEHSGNQTALARIAGKQLGGDAVLICTINRYIEREGANYSVIRPASVDFTYKLVSVESGQVLCSGIFDETQQSLFADIFSFAGSIQRGLKWITAEALAREGIKKKFNTCPHLKN